MTRAVRGLAKLTLGELAEKYRQTTRDQLVGLSATAGSAIRKAIDDELTAAERTHLAAALDLEHRCMTKVHDGVIGRGVTDLDHELRRLITVRRVVAFHLGDPGSTI
jgi:hypothetical protein